MIESRVIEICGPLDGAAVVGINPAFSGSHCLFQLRVVVVLNVTVRVLVRACWLVHVRANASLEAEVLASGARR